MPSALSRLLTPPSIPRPPPYGVHREDDRLTGRVWWEANRLQMKGGQAFRKRLTDSVETALRVGQGSLIVHILGREDLKMSEARSCCGVAYPELAPPLFSISR